MNLTEGIGLTFIVFGVAFSVLGVIGIVRLPDAYSRLHASGKTATLGVIFLCVGAAVLAPSNLVKLIALVLFMMFSAPVASHAIAASIYRSARKGEDEDRVLRRQQQEARSGQD